MLSTNPKHLVTLVLLGKRESQFLSTLPCCKQCWIRWVTARAFLHLLPWEHIFGWGMRALLVYSFINKLDWPKVSPVYLSRGDLQVRFCTTRLQRLGSDTQHSDLQGAWNSCTTLPQTVDTRNLASGVVKKLDLSKKYKSWTLEAWNSPLCPHTTLLPVFKVSCIEQRGYITPATCLTEHICVLHRQ